jgi:hypothetical protein
MGEPQAELAEGTAMTEAELERLRERLQTSLGALETRLSELRDWRSWVRRHPWPFLLGAVATGVLVGLRWKPIGAPVTRR